MDVSIPAKSTPQEVVDIYFEACRSNKYDLWLATLAVEARANATNKRPGPFSSLKWDLGRARFEKYKAAYKYLGVYTEYMYNTEPLLVLKYDPVYGPVPGYEEGKALGEEVRITLKKEGGEEGEWRITEGGF